MTCLSSSRHSIVLIPQFSLKSEDRWLLARSKCGVGQCLLYNIVKLKFIQQVLILLLVTDLYDTQIRLNM